MKKSLTILLLVAATTISALAQGLVKFSNSATTLVSTGPIGGPSGTTPPGPSYYYALLTAPFGTTDPLAFTFAGIYATNTWATTGGRFRGGSAFGVPVAGWAAGETRSFEVAAWSADGGFVWNPSWLTMDGWYVGPAFFGFSPIGSGFAGGTDSLGNNIPPLAIFGAVPAISSGFNLQWIPEPAPFALAGLGAATLMIFLRHRRGLSSISFRQ